MPAEGEGAAALADWSEAMVEKLLRECVAAMEMGPAAFLRALNGRRADCGHARWRRSDLVAWRSPRLTADMMLPKCG